MKINKLLEKLSENSPIIKAYYISYLNKEIETIEDCLVMIVNHFYLENNTLKDELIKSKQKMCPGAFWKELVDNYEKTRETRR